MSSGSRVHAYFFLMARLAAIWSILPPPGVCSSPTLHLAGMQEQQAKPQSPPTKPHHQAILDSDYSVNSDITFREIFRVKRTSAGAKVNESGGEATVNQVQNPNLIYVNLPATSAVNETHLESESEALDNDTTYDYLFNDTLSDLDRAPDNSTENPVSNIKVYEFQIIKVINSSLSIRFKKSGIGFYLFLYFSSIIDVNEIGLFYR